MAHAGQVRIYLFRKLYAPPNELQREVREEAIAEVLSQVLGGHSSTVFSCGQSDTGGDPEDVVTRIFGELFSSEQSPEQTDISVRHVKLSAESDDLAAILTSCVCRTALDLFVATPRELQAYVERVKDKMGLESECGLLMFSILVGQKSSVDCGQLQLVHLKIVEEDSQTAGSDSESEVKSQAKTESEAPLETLRKLLQALAHNTKTHLRYHNVRLTRLLKELLGKCGRTVLINFTDEPKRWEPVVASSSGSDHDELTAEVWQAMYRRERRKYCCLREKVLSEGAGKLKDMEQFLDSLEGAGSAEERCETRELEQDLMQKLMQIRAEAELTIKQLASLKEDMDHMAEQNRHHEQQLDQKNRQLARLSKQLTSAREELRSQRLQFKQKLAEDLGQLSSLCRQQSRVQLQVHRRHLTEVIDLILQEKDQQYQQQQGEATRAPLEDEETEDEPPEKP